MTLLIKNVRIVGGARDFAGESDVFVSDDKISAIGNFPNKRADVVLDGLGAYLSPGFIDVNTDSDHYLTLFEHRGQEDFLRQGVTTIFGGMCGASLAPLIYGSLESIAKWTRTDRVNVNWHTMEEFLEVLDRHPLSVNFGTLAGHATIRRAIVGEALRDLTKNELNVFLKTLRGALSEGAFGMSSGLAYVHARKTSYAELKSLAELVKTQNGVYATHLRDTGKGIKASVEETIKLAKETGVKTIVSHFIPPENAEKEYEAALEMIEALPPDIDLNFDIYPSPHSLLPIYTFLPLWAQSGGIDVMFENVKDEWYRARIKKNMTKFDEGRFVIAQAPGNEFLVGKSLHDIKEMYELKDGRDALLRLMVTMGMRGAIFYRNLSERLIKRAIQSPRSLIASNAPSFVNDLGRRELKSERTTRTFTDFLMLVEKGKSITLPDAIKKITLQPAKKFDLPLRGLIQEGYYADLACFKNGEVHFTVVNGRLVMQNGGFKGLYPGKALRHTPGAIKK